MQFYEQLGLAVLGGGLVSALINVGFNHWKERQRKQEEARYLALRLAVQFEDFAVQCANDLSDSEVFAISFEAEGAPLPLTPEIRPLFESTAYPYLDSELLSEIFDFPHRRIMAIIEAREVDKSMDYEDERYSKIYRNTVLLCQQAFELSEKIRLMYGLPKRNFQFGYFDAKRFSSFWSEVLEEEGVSKLKPHLEL